MQDKTDTWRESFKEPIKRRNPSTPVLTYIFGAALDDGMAEHLLQHVLPEDGHLLREEPQLLVERGRE